MAVTEIRCDLSNHLVAKVVDGGIELLCKCGKLIVIRWGPYKETKQA